jgi:hypothetical protein
MAVEQNEQVPGEVKEGAESPAPQVSKAEEEARAQGWVPKDEFNGEEHKWVDAGEFLRRGELFGKIESQNKELRAIRDTLAQFKDHHNKVQEAAYKKAIEDLKAKKKEALLDNDADLVIEVDEQLADVKATQRTIQAQARQPEPQQEHPEFVAFKQKNSWYDSYKPMRAWADVRGMELAQEGKSPSEVLRQVEREVRSEFPTKFENPNRTKPNAVEGSPQRGRAAEGAYSPNETERELAKKFVRQGLFKNEQEY